MFFRFKNCSKSRFTQTWSSKFYEGPCIFLLFFLCDFVAQTFENKWYVYENLFLMDWQNRHHLNIPPNSVSNSSGFSTEYVFIQYLF